MNAIRKVTPTTLCPLNSRKGTTGDFAPRHSHKRKTTNTRMPMSNRHSTKALFHAWAVPAGCKPTRLEEKSTSAKRRYCSQDHSHQRTAGDKQKHAKIVNALETRNLRLVVDPLNVQTEIGRNKRDECDHVPDSENAVSSWLLDRHFVLSQSDPVAPSPRVSCRQQLSVQYTRYERDVHSCIDCEEETTLANGYNFCYSISY